MAISKSVLELYFCNPNYALLQPLHMSLILFAGLILTHQSTQVLLGMLKIIFISVLLLLQSNMSGLLR